MRALRSCPTACARASASALVRMSGASPSCCSSAIDSERQLLIYPPQPVLIKILPAHDTSRQPRGAPTSKRTLCMQLSRGAADAEDARAWVRQICSQRRNERFLVMCHRRRGARVDLHKLPAIDAVCKHISRGVVVGRATNKCDTEPVPAVRHVHPSQCGAQ